MDGGGVLNGANVQATKDGLARVEITIDHHGARDAAALALRPSAGSCAMTAPARSGHDLRALARELSEGLRERGLTLLEVERVAAMMVDQFRRSGPNRASSPGAGDAT